MMKKGLSLLVILALLFLAACGSNSGSGSAGGGGTSAGTAGETSSGAAGGSGTSSASEQPQAKEVKSTKLVVASKNFTEQYILAQIMGQLLDHHTDHKVEIHEGGYATSAILNQGAMDGNLHVFVDYTGTGYINVLKNQLLPEDTPDTVYEKTKKGYEEKFGLIWLEPLGFSNTFTLIMKEDKAKNLNVKTFTDLAPLSKDLVIGMDAAFYSRVDGYQALAKVYGFDFKSFKEMDIALAFTALAQDEIDVLVAYSTDGRIPALNLVSLQDDKNFFPPYHAAPIVPKRIMEEYPDVAETLNLLAGKISEPLMAEMNAKVDVDKMSTADVAREFLESAGLLN